MKREDYARAFDEAGYTTIPLRPGTKVPSDPRWQDAPRDPMRTGWHIRKGFNYAVLLDALGVIDVDTTPASRPIFDKMRKDGVWHSPLETGTFKGRHVFTRLADQSVEVKSRIRALGYPWDWKLTGCVVGPGSHIEETGWTYQLLTKEIVPPECLPAFPVEWLKEVKPMPAVKLGVERVREATGKIARPDLYVLRIPSVQGSNGSAGLVRATCVLRDAGWTPEQIFEFLSTTYNERCCVPKWSDSEIRRCVERHCS